MDLAVLIYILLFFATGAATVYFIYVLTAALNMPDEPRRPKTRIRVYSTVLGLIALAFWIALIYVYVTAATGD